MFPPNLPPSNTSSSRHAALTAFVWCMLGVAVLSLVMISTYLISLFMGAIIALMAFPLQRWLQQRWQVRARWSALLVTGVVLVLVVAPLLIFATMAVRQGIALADYLQQSELSSFANITALGKGLRSWQPLANMISQANLKSQLEGAVQAGVSAGSMVVLSLAKSIPLGLLNLVLACLTCYFLLIDGRRFLAWGYARLPLAYDVRVRVTRAFRDTAVSTVWASMAAALAQALVISAAFFVLGVPGAFLAGGITFILAFVPFAGSFPAWGLACVYLGLQHEWGRMAGMVAFGLFTGGIDNVIRPWVLKGRSEMHPLVSLIAIIGGIETFGIFGAFIGPICAALLISLLQLWPEIGARYGVQFDTGMESQVELNQRTLPLKSK